MSENATPVVESTVQPSESQVAEQAQTQQNAEPKSDKPSDFLAPKFAALTRKEKQIREYERSLKAKEAELAAKFAEYETKSKSSAESESQLLSKLKNNPLKTLSELGLTYEQLTEMQLNDENPTPQMQMERMRAELKAEMEEKYGKLAETIKEKEERELREAVEREEAGYKSTLSDFVNQNSEKYELIVANGATELMFDTAKAYYERSVEDYNAGRIKAPKIPSIEEIADAVEAHLEEQAKEILKLKKFQKNITAQPQEAKPQAQQTAPTLSNTLAAEVPKSGTSKLTDEQSLELAAKMLRWNS